MIYKQLQLRCLSLPFMTLKCCLKAESFYLEGKSVLTATVAAEEQRKCTLVIHLRFLEHVARLQIAFAGFNKFFLPGSWSAVI